MHTPKQNTATAYLRARLASDPMNRLPTIAECARSAGVSYVTMWKAFTALRKNGEPTGTAGIIPPSAPKNPRWQQVCELIVRDIICGRISSADVCSLKGMTAEYGACYRTTKSALESLAAQGWLKREKKQYRILNRVAGASGETVVLLSTIDRSKSVTTLSSRFQELIRSTEIHCSRMRLGLEPVYLRKQHGAQLLSAIPAGKQIAGYLVWIGDLGTEQVTVLLEMLARTGKPVAILDETGEVPFDAAMSAAGPQTLFFSMANSKSAGRSLGRYLLELNHRNIGFFSDSKGQRWADNRYAGLCETCAMAGPGITARFFDTGSGTKHTLFTTAIQDALEDRSISAWIAVTDALANKCLSALAANGLKHGRTIAVAGFDDTPDAFLHDLTSYNFNCDATIHAMLTHLAGHTPRPAAHTRHEPLEIEGFITPRGSTFRRESA